MKKNIIKMAYYFFIAIITAWFVISWLEIGFKTSSPNSVYHAWNLFHMFFGW